jgi:vacuolar-type H+-ATPase subunit E/Vma4
MRNDLDLCLALDNEIYENYVTALEFISSSPDYSLLKFRKIIDSVITLFSERSNIIFDSEKLVDRIKDLHESQIINSALKNNLHEVRKLGNSGVHTSSDAERGHQEFRKNILIENARTARKLTVSILEDLYCFLKKKLVPLQLEFSPEGNQDLQKLLLEAHSQVCAKLKLKAGIVCETILADYGFTSGLVVSFRDNAHLEQLENSAIGFYNAACQISADPDSHWKIPYEKFDLEVVTQKFGDLEALFKYASLAIRKKWGEELNAKARGRLRAAADRGYGAAESLYGTILYEKGDYEESLKYLEKGSQKDEPLALRALYVAYSSGNGFEVDAEKALSYLNRGIELGCPDSIAMLGAAYHKGTIVKRDYDRAESLLQESIKKGSAWGKNYFIVEFNNLAETISNRFAEIGEGLSKIMDSQKKRPITIGPKPGRNEMCFCGSQKKFKKCCGLSI